MISLARPNLSFVLSAAPANLEKNYYPHVYASGGKFRVILTEGILDVIGEL